MPSASACIHAHRCRGLMFCTVFHISDGLLICIGRLRRGSMACVRLCMVNQAPIHACSCPIPTCIHSLRQDPSSAFSAPNGSCLLYGLYHAGICAARPHFTLSARMALSMASTMTPTSANTAHHMLAKPSAPSSSTMPFTPSANTMFWRTMPMVLRAMPMA